MSTEVNSHRILRKNFIKCVGRALALCHLQFDFGTLHAVLNLQELFLEVKRRHKLVNILINLIILLLSGDNEWARETKGEVQFVFLGLRGKRDIF